MFFDHRPSFYLLYSILLVSLLHCLHMQIFCSDVEIGPPGYSSKPRSLGAYCNLCNVDSR